MGRARVWRPTMPFSCGQTAVTEPPSHLLPLHVAPEPLPSGAGGPCSRKAGECSRRFLQGLLVLSCGPTGTPPSA